MGIENVDMLPYKSALQVGAFSNTVYQCKKIVQFIENNGVVDMSKSMFNIKNAFLSEDILMQSIDKDLDTSIYLNRSLSASHLRIYYLDRIVSQDPHCIYTTCNTTAKGTNDSNLPKAITYLTFVFGEEVKEDKFLLNLLAAIVRREIDLVLFDTCGIRVVNKRTNQFEFHYEGYSDNIDEISFANFIVTVYNTFVQILDQIIDLKYDDFDLLYEAFHYKEYPGRIDIKDEKEFYNNLFDRTINFSFDAEEFIIDLTKRIICL